MTTNEPIMRSLREDTSSLHEQAERQPFQQSLFRGALPRETYVDSLEQLYLVHRCLEDHLQRAATRVPAIASVLRDYQMQVPHLLADLAYFGRRIDTVSPTAGTRAMIDAIQRTAVQQPVALLGFHYVLEGSKNGARMLRERVRRAYELPDNAGTRSLDPYGDCQKARWTEFKTGMDAAAFAPHDRQAIIEAARQTFLGLIALYGDLYSDSQAVS